MNSILIIQGEKKKVNNGLGEKHSLASQFSTSKKGAVGGVVL